MTYRTKNLIRWEDATFKQKVDSFGNFIGLLLIFLVMCIFACYAFPELGIKNLIAFVKEKHREFKYGTVKDTY